MVPVATLLGAQHYKASTGFSSSNTHRTTNFATLAKINKSKKSPIIINVCIHRRTVWKTGSYAKYVILLRDYYYYYYIIIILFEIWHLQNFISIFTKGRNFTRGDNSKKNTRLLFFHEESIHEVSRRYLIAEYHSFKISGSKILKKGNNSKNII